MNRWPYEVRKCSKVLIEKFCVNDPVWQEFRLSMKGHSTAAKLWMLDRWRYNDIMKNGNLTVKTQTQVDNYVNALKRGGQLNMQLEVVK